jgi:murein DD-endopeptidase MepM/ murein hydrolase activator NlpD
VKAPARRALALAAASALLAACPAPRPLVRPSERPRPAAPRVEEPRPAAPPGPAAPAPAAGGPAPAAGGPAPAAARAAGPFPLPTTPGHDEIALAGVVHVVRRGETLWRIARAYGIDPRDLMETNGIDDARALATGTELFVPGATELRAVPDPAAPVQAGAPGGAPVSASIAAPGPTATAPRPPAPASATSAPGAAATRLSWPLKGVLYGRYGVREGKRHDGIDIAAPEGTPVLAAADGAVLFAGEQSGYGSIVILRHEGNLVTVYAHNSRLLVSEGERVRRGQPIAHVGQTGRTTGPHLHFEVREGTRPRNPLLYLP